VRICLCVLGALAVQMLFLGSGTGHWPLAPGLSRPRRSTSAIDQHLSCWRQITISIAPTRWLSFSDENARTSRFIAGALRTQQPPSRRRKGGTGWILRWLAFTQRSRAPPNRILPATRVRNLYRACIHHEAKVVALEPLGKTLLLQREYSTNLQRNWPLSWGAFRSPHTTQHRGLQLPQSLLVRGAPPIDRRRSLNRIWPERNLRTTAR